MLKALKSLLLQNHWADWFETWYVKLLNRVCINDYPEWILTLKLKKYIFLLQLFSVIGKASTFIPLNLRGQGYLVTLAKGHLGEIF